MWKETLKSFLQTFLPVLAGETIMKLVRDDFFRGVCTALAVVVQHDEPTIWREIVDAVGLADLLQYVSVAPEEKRLAGFDRYLHKEFNEEEIAQAYAEWRKARSAGPIPSVRAGALRLIEQLNAGTDSAG
jgi:CheY-like chemotaxis protein